ncbi:MAG TPA: chemotaxis response regulator protein-glutamate methylesterase [Xanthobacteraceae bacterium]|nr:chemotaxis response regulator protein-glutamate methylesterase [Xanthobacteraceae bacterium]
MSSVLAAANPASRTETPIRVMVVDDAVVVRSLLARWVDAESDMQVVASLRTGREAVARIEDSAADVVVLDIDMPELDGISALPLLLQKKRDLAVIMVSTLTRRSAEISLRALALGAADYIPKPETAREATTSVSFRRELIEKIRTLGRNHTPPRAFARPAMPVVAPPRARLVPAQRPRKPAPHETPLFQLRPLSAVPPRALVIGSSTGGPQALTALVEKLPAAVDRAPVLITQHMPPMFTTVLAEHLSRAGGRGAHEAEDGEPVLAGGIYVAPGGRHMRVVSGDNGIRIALGNDPPINFCKPAVDALFTSAAAVWGAATLAVVLTGMGADGTHGATDIVAAGGSVIAQDEATSVVWGMPRSVALAGLCAAVLPLDQIAPKVIRLLAGARA